MFETSLFLLIKALLINLLVPFISWALFLWLFFWDKYKWVIFYLLSFFVWSWVIAFSLFNIQFIHFWVWIFEYLLINLFLLLALISTIIIKKEKVKKYLNTLKLRKIDFLSKYFELNLWHRVFFIFSSFFIWLYVFIASVFNFNFPTYSDDNFWNWNNPVINIYNDWGVKIFGEENEILWRWRLWYPIYFAIYKALISDLFWSYNDIYIDLWQFLTFFWILIFSFFITYNKTNNLFFSILSWFLICSISLIFFHAVDWYYDLTSAIYSILTIYFIYEFLNNNDFDNLSLWIIFWSILANIKNDWLIVYLSWIIIAFFIFIFIKKRFTNTIKILIKEKLFLVKTIFFLSYFLVPFIILKSYLWLGYNQAAWESAWVWIWFHPEIFSVFDDIFLMQDNYNLVILIILFLVFNLIKKYKEKSIWNELFIYLAFFLIFFTFILVFLLTQNYMWALNQTTINRVFSMCFMILFAFFWLLIFDSKKV